MFHHLVAAALAGKEGATAAAAMLVKEEAAAKEAGKLRATFEVLQLTDWNVFAMMALSKVQTQMFLRAWGLFDADAERDGLEIEEAEQRRGQWQRQRCCRSLQAAMVAIPTFEFVLRCYRVLMCDLYSIKWA